MSRHISPGCFYNLPSGTRVHPCRLIEKDGTIMWKHALLNRNELLALPQTAAHESHIVKTAQRVEELNSWLSQDKEPWEFLKPVYWYMPTIDDLSEGIAVYLKHTCINSKEVYDILTPHVKEYEKLDLLDSYIYFRRC